MKLVQGTNKKQRCWLKNVKAAEINAKLLNIV